MAKKNTPVFYCKWCDEVLKTDCQFCSQPCRQIWTKTRNTPSEKVIALYRHCLDALKENDFNIPLFCKERYKMIESDLQHYNEGYAKKLATAEGALYAYIYNKKKDKVFKAFEKYKRLAQDGLDACLFDGKKSELCINHEDGTKTILSGEESFRVDAIVTKLSVQSFELMLAQTFP